MPTTPTISLIFPGQGSQAVGMGQALAAAYPLARAVFDEVDAALGEKLSAMIADGPAETLTLTRNAQPALMAVSVAAFRVLCAEGLAPAQVHALAGHSLGEYSAYCAGGAISLADTARLLRLRGEAMQDAVPVGEGTMAAVLGLELDALAAAIAGTGAVIANDNAPGQVVISGSMSAVEAACLAARAAGAKRALPLPVSAPFHSPSMAPAAARMAEALAATTITAPFAPVYSNVTAGPVTDPDEIRRTLTVQVTGQVRWTETVRAMATAGTTTFIEVGAGKVLAGLVRRIAEDLGAFSFGAPDDLAPVRAAFAS